MAKQFKNKFQYLYPSKVNFQGKYFYKLIWLGCISVCIPIILVSTLYYQFSMSRELTQFQVNTQSSLNLIKDRFENLFQEVEQASLQLALDPLIKRSFSMLSFNEKMFYHLDMLDKISLIKNANPLIKDVIYYQAESNVILSNEYGNILPNNGKYTNDVLLAMKSGKQAQWVYLSEGTGERYISFVRLLPVMTPEKPSGLIITRMDTEMIESYLMNFSSVSDDRSYIILDSEEQVLFQSQDSDIYGRGMGTEIVLKKMNSGEFTTSHFTADDLEGTATFYSYVKSPYGRIYIASIPEHEIAKQMSYIRWFTIFAVVTFMSIGVMLTIIVSKRAYNPIEQLVKYGKNLSEGGIKTSNDMDAIKECFDYLSNESEQLATYMNKLEPTLRERFLQRLSNVGNMDRSTILSECEAYGITIRRTYIVLIVKIEKLYHLYQQKRFSSEELSIVTFAMTNVMQELLEQQSDLDGYVYQTSDKNGVALLHFSSSDYETRMLELTKQYANSICESMKKYLTFTVSVGIGRFYPHIADVPVSHREAALALQYRIYKDTDTVMYIGDLEHSRKQSMFFYPSNIETSIVEFLSKGEINQAEQALNEFSSVVCSSKSYNFVYQSYQMLLSRIIQSLDNQGGSILDILEHDLFDDLKERQTFNEISDWFIENLFPLYKKVTEESRHSFGKAAIKQVCRYIKENTNSDISLVQCADLINLSPSYLSRLFKKETGMSFLEYVKNCKIDEAKRLLLETDEKVSEIARAIGYSERNLNRMFQQNKRMSPSQFRSEHR